MSDPNQRPCDYFKELKSEVNYLKKEFSDFKKETSNEVNYLKIKFATIDVKLNFIIGGVVILSVAVAAVVVPTIF